MPITTLASRELIRTPAGRTRRPKRPGRQHRPRQPHVLMIFQHYERLTGSHRSIVDPVHAGLSALSWTSHVRADAPHGSDTRCYADEEVVGFPLDYKARVKLERVQQRRLDRQFLTRR